MRKFLSCVCYMLCMVQVYFLRFLLALFSHPYFVNFLCVTFDIMCKRFSAKVTGHVRKERARANTHPHFFSRMGTLSK